MINSENEAITALKALSDALDKIESKKTTGINIFDAVGMSTQEVKHSAFLAWLLDPNKPHGLGNAVLKLLLEKVRAYPAINRIPSNAEIIAKISEDFSDSLQNAPDLIVETEKVLFDPNSRIDIFIRSDKNDKTLVIENKVFTSTHDDQLKRYEHEAKLLGGDTLFIYLTPHGDIPTDINGNYQQGWCMIDYKTITDIVKESMRSIPRTKNNAKLIGLTEDYISTVDTNILKNNAELRKLCKEIRRKHADAIAILTSYSDNIEDVMERITNEWLPSQRLNVQNVQKQGRNISFTTQAMSNHYAGYGESIIITDMSRPRLRINISCKDGLVVSTLSMEKNQDSNWTKADEAVRDLIAPGKRMGNKYCTLYSFELLSEEDRELDIQEILPKLDKRLDMLAQKIIEFDKLLSK